MAETDGIVTLRDHVERALRDMRDLLDERQAYSQEKFQGIIDRDQLVQRSVQNQMDDIKMRQSEDRVQVAKLASVVALVTSLLVSIVIGLLVF